ncbi:N-acetylmuramoyl-L-alanine amidase [Nocardia amamiensis]|uniref:N-acetylmuramoyl-L-alanine amidase n=1 Tax=Nocardia amamiensis TaxID=404578 RepID=UPI00082DD9CB|nr:N-acetylmuramoyl-L-alanine amidase [Nocardia amamiensis]
MRYRKPKRSYVLPVVTTLAVAAPLVTLTLGDSTDYQTANDSQPAAVPAQLAEVTLTRAPDIVLPLRELTGLDLPDLRLSDLRMLPIPESIPVPDGLPLPPGVRLPERIPLPEINSGQTSGLDVIPGQTSNSPNSPAPVNAGIAPGSVRFIADPDRLHPGTTPDTPALSPGALTPELMSQVGAQVKELSRDTPFSMVALTAKELANTKATIRARQSNGTWGPWYETEPVDTHRSDHSGPGATNGTEPIYVGNTNAVQVLVTRNQAAAPEVEPVAQPGAIAEDPVQQTDPQPGEPPEETNAQPGDPAEQTDPHPGVPTQQTDPQPGDPAQQTGPHPGDPAQQTDPQPGDPAQQTDPRPGEPAQPRSDDVAQLIPDLTAVLIDPGRGTIDGLLHNVAAALPGGGPAVITRAQWGADESIRCDEPTYDDGLGGVTVHHTAGRNDYSKSESAGIVRAIYTYHAKTLGWCDIGYNALVDKYGQVFEGRFGGLDRPVQGAHAGGFNENTSGVALMGDYESIQPTQESIDAIGAFVGWRTKVAGLNPKGYTTMYSEGTPFTPYPQGEAVRLPIVFAHRDVGSTNCPGDAAYALMNRIRDIAAGAPGAPGGYHPQTPPGTELDVAALAELTTKLLNMVHDNIIARHWSQSGGPNGPLGAAQSEVLPAAHGQQYAKFTNGYVYTVPDGQVVEVLGTIRDRFLQLGADTGILGLPLRGAYPVPDGLRADFQHGSLILNQLTNIVTTILKTHNDTHREEPRRNSPAAGPAPANVPDQAGAASSSGSEHVSVAR